MQRSNFPQKKTPPKKTQIKKKKKPRVETEQEYEDRIIDMERRQR